GERIGDANLAKTYAYTELYDSTLTYARQIQEKNKFLLKGEYRSTTGGVITLGAMNIPRGSVVVTANGITLTENVDYTVDYILGVVTIINQTLLDSRTPISVTCESLNNYETIKRTLFGVDLQYAYNKDLNFTGTIIHLSEKPSSNKLTIGNEAISNTIWGLGVSYKTESQWLTNMIDKVPWINASQPSKITAKAEMANLIVKKPNEDEYAYLDDFESSQSVLDISSPYAWSLGSIPYDNGKDALFPEASYNNDVRYGKNRSLLAWYQIDNLFTQNTSQTPDEIRRDKDQLSDPRVRQVLVRELFPDRQTSSYEETSTLPIFNLAFYPKERGPYNVEVDEIGTDFKPLYPEKRVGSIMRKMDATNFENANFEYIQFWLLDPFEENTDGENGEGELYFNIGDISEDILKDGRKFYESGLSISGDTSTSVATVWGRVPKNQSLSYSFDNSSVAKENQDVGLDGLKNSQEYTFPTYSKYVNQLEGKLSSNVKQELKADPFSPFNDPSGDNYKHYLDYSSATILQRYKHNNGTEGNSLSTEHSSRSTPDVEDINQDNTLNSNERYFEYKVSIRRSDMMVGKNYISDMKETSVTLANGKVSHSKWYQFKIPLREYSKMVGNIEDFTSIRFMRIFLTGFKENVVLRMASFELVRGDWRTYTKTLTSSEYQPITNASVKVSAVNIEENGSRKPVNYVLPPGVSRATDPSQPQNKQLNEQSLSIEIEDLSPNDARAVYKNTSLDLRRYNALQLFTHAEAIEGKVLNQGDVSIFMRLGSDYNSNYYEYSNPLTPTPHGTYYDNSRDRERVWPEDNRFNIKLSSLTDLKKKRNAERRKGNPLVNLTTIFSLPDAEKSSNTISIKGNPSLGNVKTILIGIKNNAGDVRSVVVWIDELRMCGFDDEGGWAVKGSLDLLLSDIAVLNTSVHYESSGFGSVEDRLQERRMSDLFQYNVSTSVDVGRLIPEKIKLKAPLYYSISEKKTTPKYDPLDTDITLKDALEGTSSKEKDSILDYAVDKTTTKSFSLSNLCFNIKSKKPMPYDPSNFKFSYVFSESNTKNPTTKYEVTRNYKGSINYTYAPLIRPLKPFKKMKSKSSYSKFIREFSLNYLPNSIVFSSTMKRYYYELQSRSITSGTINNDIPLVFRKDFTWNRQFGMVWNLAKSFRFDINTATDAVIDEPNVAVNKEL
ncbi:MAG TPA: cell surface protein SprA, partial [Porphyromonadaceae bacterium]|nr:cell surface protein SprA [Porphyromonadaceae bacterium]